MNHKIPLFNKANYTMHIHFIGIGGTAMGSVAVACRMQGHRVTGSDGPVYEPMRSVLDNAGIERFEGYDANRLRELHPDLTVIGNAISRGNPELEFVLDERWLYTSMAELVGRLFIDRNTSIVCCGTHGKTTTSSITAWLLEHGGFLPGFLIGGVPGNFDLGCRPAPQDTHNTRAGVFVSEGDEYDTAFFDKRSKFVHYKPHIAIINNLEFDHADIFDSVDAIVRSFQQMVRIIPRSGVALVNADDERALRTVQGAPCSVETVGVDDRATWRISDVHDEGGVSVWTLHHNEVLHGVFRMPMPGLHNVRNATMAIAATFHAGMRNAEQAAALEEFVPPKRRLEELCIWHGATVIDDFAHHPTAIAGTIAALQQKYPTSAIHAVFEPRSNTTTRNFFQHELAECFRGASTVWLGPVNRPERYAEHERLDTGLLVHEMSNLGIAAHAMESALSADPAWGRFIQQQLRDVVAAGDVIAILSNGDVGNLRKLLIAESSAS